MRRRRRADLTIFIHMMPERDIVPNSFFPFLLWMVGSVGRRLGRRRHHRLRHLQSVDHFFHVFQIAGRGRSVAAARAAADGAGRGAAHRRERRRRPVVRRRRSFGTDGLEGGGRRIQSDGRRFVVGRTAKTVRSESVVAPDALLLATFAAGWRRRGRSGVEGQNGRWRRRRQRQTLRRRMV